MTQENSVGENVVSDKYSACAGRQSRLYGGLADRRGVRDVVSQLKRVDLCCFTGRILR